MEVTNYGKNQPFSKKKLKMADFLYGGMEKKLFALGNKNLRLMCRFNLALDDALMEVARPTIGKDIAVQKWLEEMLHKALASYVEQVTSKSQSRSEKLCEQVKALGDTPEGFFALHTVLKPSNCSAEELRDEYISEKYGV